MGPTTEATAQILAWWAQGILQRFSQKRVAFRCRYAENPDFTVRTIRSHPLSSFIKLNTGLGSRNQGVAIRVTRKVRTPCEVVLESMGSAVRPQRVQSATTKKNTETYSTLKHSYLYPCWMPVEHGILGRILLMEEILHYLRSLNYDNIFAPCSNQKVLQLPSLLLGKVLKTSNPKP